MSMEFLSAYLIGILLAAVSGPIGCILVWKRITFISDSLTHSLLLGLVLGVLTSSNQLVTLTIFAVAIALIITYFQSISYIKIDLILALITSGSIAIAMLIRDYYHVKLDLHSAFFGDILLIDNKFLIYSSFMLLVIGLALFKNWNDLLILTLNEEIAKSMGMNILLLRFIILTCLSLFSVIAVKLIGVLLISSLLTIPAAIARIYSKSPNQMARLSSLIGVTVVILGLTMAIYLNLSPGPVISACAVSLFLLSLITKSALDKKSITIN